MAPRLVSNLVTWANRLDAPPPLPRFADLPPVPELDEALIATAGARITFDGLAEDDRVRLTLFVRTAWTRWGRGRRAAIVARECAGGPRQVEAWQINNRTIGRGPYS